MGGRAPEQEPKPEEGGMSAVEIVLVVGMVLLVGMAGVALGMRMKDGEAKFPLQLGFQSKNMKAQRFHDDTTQSTAVPTGSPMNLRPPASGPGDADPCSPMSSTAMMPGFEEQRENAMDV